MPSQLGEAVDLLSPADVHVAGWLGERVSLNEHERLLNTDLVPFLAGYHKKPGTHPWIGEHIGKWIHAATLAWVNTGDEKLKKKLDGAVAELISTQEADGYLGTYVPEERFNRAPAPGHDAGWDVWSHKYNLIALETYYEYTGSPEALASCRKMADLLLRIFPAERSIIDSGWHVGMASTSVLEPIVVLYEITADQRYLAFAQYIVKSWDELRGPAILKALLAGKGVDEIGNAKAYEMTSNIVGMCELARVTGDRSLLQAVFNAWNDIVKHQLYITGTASQWERFQADHDLRNDPGAHVGETCVTVTWIELNLKLLTITGEAKYAQELERSFYNHLAAAQNPAGQDWCYYTPLEGSKPYDSGITCCHSSGPRGMAMIPQASYLQGRSEGHDVVLIDTLETSHATLTLGGERVTIDQESGFPYEGTSVLTLHLRKPATFSIKLLTPEWALPIEIERAQTKNGWTVVSPREWKEGDRLSIKFKLTSRMIQGAGGNNGNAALSWGPFVLACDELAGSGLPKLSALGFASSQSPVAPLGRHLTFKDEVVGRGSIAAQPARFIPFADAGADGSPFRVWLRAPGVAVGDSDPLLDDGQWGQSRQGRLQERAEAVEQASMHTTFDGTKAAQDWFSVTLHEPTTVGRVVFVHGTAFPNGGWFDTSKGKPSVQVRKTATSDWETVGTLDNYPATTAAQGRRLQNGQAFMVRLPQPISVWAVRVVGIPAGGSDTSENFVTCAGLQAYRR